LELFHRKTYHGRIITSSIGNAYEWGIYYDANAKCDGIGYNNEY